MTSTQKTAPLQQSVKSPSFFSRTFEALRYRDFRLIWLTSIASSFAMNMQILARGWLIFDLTESEIALTWVMLSFLMPSAIFSFFGGTLADRMNKKTIIVGSQLFTTISTFVFALIIYFGTVKFWHFICFGLINGTVLALTMPARTAVIPDIVVAKSLTNALALANSTWSLARVVGPTIAGYLIALFAAGDHTSIKGVGIVFFVITLMYGVSTAGTCLLHFKGEPVRGTPKSFSRDFLEGLVYVRRNRLVLGLLLMSLLPMTFGFSAQFLLPALNVDVLNGDAQLLGYLSAALGIGALAGGLILARLGDIGHKGRTMFILCYLWAIGIVVLPWIAQFWLSIVVLALIGAFSAGISALNMSVIQLTVSSRVRTRVTAIMWATHGCMPLGMIPIGQLAERISIQFALFVAALLMVISALLIKHWLPEVAQVRRGHRSG
ncbi:MAG: MFS transporter [Gammaproteobacteria bacterium]|nr:MFS transporter [Gammaproteobacteria bacterium]MXX94373.1 MFS transporter [Gammaproteobacteria bacterium]MYF54046.1 MFS transporter [Gammaproteobacteria bacterium]MYK43895.1 MFS transporter [Gammaproteobacteria bacterium]